MLGLHDNGLAAVARNSIQCLSEGDATWCIVWNSSLSPIGDLSICLTSDSTGLSFAELWSSLFWRQRGHRFGPWTPNRCILSWVVNFCRTTNHGRKDCLGIVLLNHTTSCHSISCFQVLSCSEATLTENFLFGESNQKIISLFPTFSLTKEGITSITINRHHPIAWVADYLHSELPISILTIIFFFQYLNCRWTSLHKSQLWGYDGVNYRTIVKFSFHPFLSFEEKQVERFDEDERKQTISHGAIVKPSNYCCWFFFYCGKSYGVCFCQLCQIMLSNSIAVSKKKEKLRFMHVCQNKFQSIIRKNFSIRLLYYYYYFFFVIQALALIVWYYSVPNLIIKNKKILYCICIKVILTTGFNL